MDSKSHGPQYVIERIDAPSWTTAEESLEEDALLDFAGEQREWGWAIPLLYQVLAAPASRRPFPRRPSDASHDLALAYWAALLHLLIYSFGWVRPDRGMRWWYDAGKPVDDTRLRLLKELWDADGQLDWFAAWLWTSYQVADRDALEVLAGRSFERDPVRVDDEWLEETVASAESSSIASPAPIGQGWDPLHLSVHCRGPILEPAASSTLVRSSDSGRRAILVCDSMVGWYRSLAGAALPDLGERSWRVDVVVKPVGFLGTYRRSRATGLWYAGQHRFHVRGV